MTAPEIKFDLEKILRLAGGPAQIAKQAESRGIQLGQWAAYAWGKSVGVKVKYHQLLADLSGLPVEDVKAADDAFREKRRLEQEASAC